MKKRAIIFLILGSVFFYAGSVWGYEEGLVDNFFGSNAGLNNSDKVLTYNSFFGGWAGYTNTTGERNNFFGNSAGYNNSTGDYNNFFGVMAGYNNTTGYENSYFGHAVGYSSTTGRYNSFFGFEAGYLTNSGWYNSFFGRRAGYSNNSGEENSFLGYNSGYNNTSGNYNSFIGSNAGYNNSEGSNNSFFGKDAGFLNTTGSDNSFFGYRAGLSSTGTYNNFLGSYAGYSNTWGGYNNFFGYEAGYSNTTGEDNSFFGHKAGHNNTTGSYNTAIGETAGYSNTEGYGNVFLGFEAGYEETGSNKLYIANSLTDPPLIYGEFDNQYLEVNGSLNVQGTDAYNSFQYKIMGHSGGNSHTQMVTDLADSRLTVMAAEANDTAPRLQLVGPQDNSSNQGWAVLNYGSVRYNLWNAQFNVLYRTPTGIAYMLRTYGNRIVSFPTGNVGFGTTTPTHLIELAGGAYSDGATWVNASSRELKENIKEVSAEEAIRTVENLKPVAFNYKKGDQDLHVGFIAEDVPELVATGDRKGLESMDIVAVLTKVVQELQKRDQEQHKTIQELLKRDQEQLAMIGQLQTALQFKQDKNANVTQLDVVQ